MAAAETKPPAVALARTLTIAVAAVYGAWVLRHGVQTGMDTTSYSEWADQMIAHRFNVVAYLQDRTFIAPPLLYLLWIVIVAVLKLALGGWWMQGVVVLNMASFTVGTYVTLAWIARATQSSSAVVFGAALFCVAADLLIFVPFVLSDLAYWVVSTSIVVTALGLVAAHEEHLRGRRFAIGTILTMIALVLRPVALPLAIFWVIAMMAGALRDRIVRVAPLALGILGIVAVLTAMAHAYVLMEPTVWPGRLPAVFELLAREFREGILVYAPGNTNITVTPAAAWPGFVRITIEKWLYFWTPWLPHYSRAHALMNIAFFAPACIMGAFAWLRLRRLSAAQQLSVCLLLTLALLVSAFHAMTMIDYDHRYRLPLLPVLMMLAALGLEAARRPPAIYQRDSRSTD